MQTAITTAWTPDSNHSSGTKNKTSEVADVTISNSPLLFEMLKQLSTTEKSTILDMGPASQSSVEYFNDYWCKLFITDTIADLNKKSIKDSNTPDAWKKILAKSLRTHTQHNNKLDIICLWTLPNYLSPTHLKALIEYLLPYTTNRTRLHAYIYNTQKMPAVPAKYHIRRSNKVAISHIPSEQVPCPLYHLAELHNCFKPFKTDHAVMLASGIQEYIFSA